MSGASAASPVLVTGATGRHGNTGEHMVGRLIDEGRAVRVLVRSPGERSDRLAECGAEIVIGDLFDRRSLVPALAGVDLAYFTYPIAAGVVSAAANYAAAVREVDRSPRTVVMSMGPAHPDHPSDLGKAQWLAEQVLQWAGLDLTILRVSALFHENLLVLHSRSVRREYVIRNSFGAGITGWISGRDAAELGLAALLHPERFEDDVTYPKGAELFSHHDIAEILGDLLGRPVDFQPVTKGEWRDELIEMSKDSDVVNDAMAQHISSIGHAVAVSGRTLPADPVGLRRLIGRDPVTLREFLASNLHEFQAAS